MIYSIFTLKSYFLLEKYYIYIYIYILIIIIIIIIIIYYYYYYYKEGEVPSIIEWHKCCYNMRQLLGISNSGNV